MEQSVINELIAIVGEQHTLTDRESLAVYKYDSTPELESPPGAVVLPGTAEEVARIMTFCYQAGVPVTPRGSGTNLSGGSIAYTGGVVLQTSRLNRLIEVDDQFIGRGIAQRRPFEMGRHDP